MGKINKAFGKLVVKLRKQRNQSQEDFAWSIDSGNKYLSDVELGKRNVSLLFADRIARAFGLSLHELFTLLEDEMNELQGNESL